jgi:recombination protein RecA
MPKEKKTVSDSESVIIDAMDKINKRYGKGSFYKYGDAEPVLVDVVPTPSLRLNAALGVGGLPRGRISEVFGFEGSCKTSLTLQTIAQSQKDGLKCAFIDVEQALDPAFATTLGVDMDELYFTQPDSGEEAMDVLDTLVKTNQFSIIVVDSVAALTPQAELNGEIGDSHVALQARLMSQSLRKITSNVRQSNTAVVFINQVRDKISTTGYGGGGTDTPGGKALKFYCSMRLDLRRTEYLRKGEEAIGQNVIIKVIKNKLAAPFKKVTIPFYFDRGFDSENDLLNMAVDFGILERKGSWFYYGFDQIGQGKEKAFEVIKDSPDIYHEIERQVLININPNLAKMKGYDVDEPENKEQEVPKVDHEKGIT